MDVPRLGLALRYLITFPLIFGYACFLARTLLDGHIRKHG